MGSFPYTPSPSSYRRHSLMRKNHQIQPWVLGYCTHGDLKFAWKFCCLFLGVDGVHDEDVDRGCLRGLCEREMIKGREFLLISEVSAVSRWWEDCHCRKKILFSWNCVEFNGNDITSRLISCSQMVLSWAIHCALLALLGVVPKSQQNEFFSRASVFYSAVALRYNISLLLAFAFGELGEKDARLQNGRIFQR